ncbi:MAG: YiaA/YiaB family inner membrane protein [Alphaproteobacteria bacterium]
MPQHTNLFLVFNFACVCIAYFMLALALWYMPIDFSTRGYLGMGILFLSGSLITLVKTLRDVTEAEKVSEKLERAKNEKLLADYAESDAS